MDLFLFGLLLITSFVEVIIGIIFWGICYVTGALLTPLISLGSWQAGEIRWVEDDKGKKRLKRDAFTLNKEGGELYLGAFTVALLGLLFWIGIVAIFVM